MKFVVLLAVIMLALSAYGFKFMPKGITTRMVARHATSIAGETGTESYRLFFEDGGKKISPSTTYLSKLRRLLQFRE